jgi:hypothetical protein
MVHSLGPEQQPLQRRLEGSALDPFLSDYLMRGGLNQDVAVFDHVDVSGKRVAATCHMKSFFVSPHDGRFHLSGLVGTALLVQLGIVHGLLLEGSDRKSGEVYLSDYQVTLRREITETEGLPIQMDMIHCIHLPAKAQQPQGRAFYSWRFAVADGAWRGKMTMVFP